MTCAAVTALDCRGVPITQGALVVTAISGDRLMERTVKRLESGGWIPNGFVHVRFEGGFWTTPDRCAVVGHSERST